MPCLRTMPSLLLVTLLALSVTACSDAGSTNAVPDGMNAAGDGKGPAPVVSVLSLRPRTVTLFDDLPGRVAAFRTVEIRPQVGGIIERRLFEEGAFVEAGQPLFRLNAATFKADVDSAAAVLQRSEAGLRRAETKYARSKKLVAGNAVSRDTHESAAAELEQTRANVAEARATLQRRQLDLDMTTIRAPISGKIGQALTSEGALVSASGTNALAVIQQIETVYVDVRQPASQIDVIRQAERSGALEDASKVPVAIAAASGALYPVAGRALFSDIFVDPGTGNVTVRVEVENTDRVLLPGMYVRARLPRGVKHDALLIPQQAVVRDPAGRAQVMVVRPDKTVEMRDVEIGEIVQGQYIVAGNLSAGETIAVEGQERLQAGGAVETVEFQPTIAAAQR